MMTDIRIHDRILFFLGSTGVLSGIFLTNIFTKTTPFLFLFIFILSIQILFLYRSFWRYILIFLLAFCIGGILSFIRLQTIDSIADIFQKHTSYFTKEVVVQGILTEKISENNKGVRYILRDTIINGQTIPEKAGILATFTDAYNKELDDIVTFTGQLRLPVANEVFDYRTYLLLDDTYATTTVKMSTKIGTKESFWLTRFVRRVRLKLLQTIENIYP